MVELFKRSYFWCIICINYDVILALTLLRPTCTAGEAKIPRFFLLSKRYVHCLRLGIHYQVMNSKEPECHARS